MFMPTFTCKPVLFLFLSPGQMTPLGTPSVPQLLIWFSCLSKGTTLRITFVSFWAYLKLWQKERVNLRAGRRLLEDETDAGSILSGQQPPGPGTHSEPMVCMHPQMHTPHWSSVSWLRMEELS